MPIVSRAASASSSISNLSIDGNQKVNIQNNENETTSIKNSRSPSLKIPAEDKAFDIISEKLNPSRRNSFESFIVSRIFK